MSQTSAQFHDQFFITDASLAVSPPARVEGRL
jgi:hypothetical protein